MKKILITLLLAFTVIVLCNHAFAYDPDTALGKWDITVKNWDSESVFWSIWDRWSDLNLGQNEDSVSIRDNFMKTTEKYIIWMLWIIVVTVFLYIWFELATAEWKEDQFKKALKALVYAIVWLAVIPLAYILIKITTWFSF